MCRWVLLLLVLTISASAQNSTTTPVGKFPALNVQVTVGTQEKAEGASFYRRTMNIVPRMTIEGVSRMVPIPAAEATMLIITMETREKFVHLKEECKVYTTETLPIPEVKTGDRRQFNFAPSTTSFDGYRDNSNAGGEMYKYYIFALRDPATKTIIDFRSNDQALMNYCKAHPEKREELLGMAKDANFPKVK